MQSTTTRGVRRLLVSTGVISLVLSVAAPAVLAAPPPLAGTPGAQMLKVCHNGRVLEMEQAALRAHLDHGDFLVSGDLERGDACTLDDAADGEIVEGDEDQVLDEVTFVKVCRDGAVDELAADQIEGLSDHIDASAAVEDLEHGDPCGTQVDVQVPDEDTGDATFVEVCHHGEVLEIEEHALDAHLGHGDVLITDGMTCGDVTLDDDDDVDGPGGGGSVIVDDTAPKDPGGGSQEPVPTPIISATSIERPTPVVPAVPATPAAPAAPQSPAQPARPVVTNAPASPAAAPLTSSRNEVLGSVTTRTPTGATVTALAATGASTTTALAVLGTVLLLAGVGLQVTARRRVRSADVGV